MCKSMQPHGLQHIRLPCPSLSSRVCSNSCPWSRWCHPTISSSFTPFSSCPQSFPASRYFPVSQLFASDSQSIGASASVWISYSNDYSGLISFRIHWFYLPCCLRNSQKSYPAPEVESISSLVLSLLHGQTLISIHDYWKDHTFDYMDLC